MFKAYTTMIADLCTLKVPPPDLPFIPVAKLVFNYAIYSETHPLYKMRSHCIQKGKKNNETKCQKKLKIFLH